MTMLAVAGVAAFVVAIVLVQVWDVSLEEPDELDIVLRLAIGGIVATSIFGTIAIMLASPAGPYAGLLRGLVLAILGVGLFVLGLLGVVYGAWWGDIFGLAPPAALTGASALALVARDGLKLLHHTRHD